MISVPLMTRKKKKPTYRKRQGITLAEKADRHVLYEKAVQCVETEVDMVDETFQTLRGRTASTIREDFCGTANTSCEWVGRRDDNRAFAVDLDDNVLAWSRLHNITRLNDSGTGRIRLLREDVLTVQTPAVDMVLAMNFSYQVFKTRQKLGQYFRTVRDALADDGILFMDAYGGYESFREMEESTEHDDFTYVWDQSKYNPINGDFLCHIHFTFADGSKIKRAFTYDWRLWTLPELEELLLEAGFSRTLVHWEGTDPKSGEGNGVYTPTRVGDADAAWICYISAEK